MINPNRTAGHRVQKLIDQYVEYGSLIIGLDFDFTVVDTNNDFKPYTDVVALVKRTQNLIDCDICIWTANKCESLVKQKLEEAEIGWDYYNESPVNFGTAKPYFNILLDDNAGLDEAMKHLTMFLDRIERGQI